MNRETVAWGLSYAYIAYIYLALVPQLGPQPIFSVVSASAFLLVAFAVSSTLLLGTRRSILLFLTAALVGFAMEALSVNTGIPFGRYFYTSGLGLTLGPVPVFIPLTWASLSFYALEAGGTYGMPFLMTFIDLSFDPRYSGNLWIWTSSTQYFGDPWSNFVGWLITSALIAFFYTVLTRRRAKPSLRGIVFYFLFGLDSCILDFYSNLATPALVSALVFAASTLVLLLIYFAHGTKTTPSTRGLESRMS